MSDSRKQTSGKNRSETGRGANRRRVLQGIGAAGVASAVMSGSGAAEGDAQGFQRAAAAAATQDVTREIPTSSQFWSFNSFLEDNSNADLIEMSAEAGLDAYEPYELDDEEAMLQAQEDTGVYMSSAHDSIDEVENDPEGKAETYSQFAHDGRIPPLIEAYQDGMWSTESDVIEFAERVNAVADEAADHDLEFGYHNHEHEFQYLDDADERAYDVFLENIEDHVYIQLDVAWCFAGIDRPNPIDYIVEYGDKIKSLHMKNWQANDSRTHGSGEEGNGELTEIHEGDLNMRAIATAARNASAVDHLVYEYDGAPDAEESLGYAGEWLNKVNHPWSPGGICAVPGADTHPAKLHNPDA